MTNAHAKLHIAKAQLGLDNDTYRAVLVRVTGKASSKDMNAAEHGRVMAEFERLGFKATLKARNKLSGPYAKKLQALWIAGYNLGLIFDRTDKALLAFARNRTSIDRIEWLVEAEHGKKAVEALKAWLERDGGVNWNVGVLTPEHKQRHGYQIASAQWRLLHPAADMTAFWAEVSRVLKRPLISSKPTDAEWVTVMNTFGKRLRDVRPKKRKAA